MYRRMAVYAGDTSVAQRMEHAAKGIGLHDRAEVEVGGFTCDGRGGEEFPVWTQQDHAAVFFFRVEWNSCVHPIGGVFFSQKSRAQWGQLERC